MEKQQFIRFTDNWGSHQPLLWHALETAKHLGLPVLELGCGDNSTPMLKQYCKDNKLKLFSYDSKKEWADKYGSIYVEDWDKKSFWSMDFGVALVDHAPGEHRKVALSRLHHVRIVVAHDTEPSADHGYKMRDELKKYKHMVDYKTDGAWASAVSNFFDVSNFKL